MLDVISGFPRRLKGRLKRLRSQLRESLPHRFVFRDPPESSPPSPYAYPINQDNFLEELGRKYQPSKRAHHYLPLYWTHLRDIRLHVQNVIEIGVQTDRSMRMWEEFFPKAMIHGIDLDPQCRNLTGERRRMHIGDQSDRAFLDRVLARIGQAPDLVIDDGSHIVRHQLASFEHLFPALSRHGVYVVEDMGIGDLRAVNALKELVDSIMYWPENTPPTEWVRMSQFPDGARWADRHTIGIAFYRWIAFVFRGQNPEDNPYLKPRSN